MDISELKGKWINTEATPREIPDFEINQLNANEFHSFFPSDNGKKNVKNFYYLDEGKLMMVEGNFKTQSLLRKLLVTSAFVLNWSFSSTQRLAVSQRAGGVGITDLRGTGFKMEEIQVNLDNCPLAIFSEGNQLKLECPADLLTVETAERSGLMIKKFG